MAFLSLRNYSIKVNIESYKKYVQDNDKLAEELEIKYGELYSIIFDIYVFTITIKAVSDFRDRHNQTLFNKIFKNSNFIKLFKRSNSLLYRAIIVDKQQFEKYKMKAIESFSSSRKSAIAFLKNTYENYDYNEIELVLIVGRNFKNTLDIKGVSHFPDENEVLVLNQKVNLKKITYRNIEIDGNIFKLKTIYLK